MSGIADTRKASVLNLAGAYLRALGRLKEADSPMQAALEIRVKQKTWDEAAANANNLSELSLAMGKVGRSIGYAEEAVQFADKGGNGKYQMSTRTTLAESLSQNGRIEEAEKFFQDAERIQQKIQPQFPFLYSLWGFRYCDFLLSRGKGGEVLNRVEHTLELEKKHINVLSIGLDHLSLGRASLMTDQHVSAKDCSNAEHFLNDAVKDLRRANAQEFISRGLLGRAELYRIKKEFSEARSDLDEAMKIASRGEMRLYQSDCHLEYARLYLAEGDKGKAKEHLSTARKMIEEMGYHRRDVEVWLINVSVALADDDKATAQEYLAEAKRLIDEKGLHGWDWEVKELEEKLIR